MYDSNAGKYAIVTGAVIALIAVVLGAFAAHALKDVLDTYSKAVFETGVRYQMYHAFGILIIGVLFNLSRYSEVWLTRAAWAFGIGITLFSGSLYILALSDIRWFGAITPIGGASLLLGWVFLAVSTCSPRTN